MSRLKKLGVPKEIEPTLDILDRIAEGEDLDIDIGVVIRNLSLVQYYLRGKIDGMKIETDEDKKIAGNLIIDAQEELKNILEIVTGTT